MSGPQYPPQDTLPTGALDDFAFTFESLLDGTRQRREYTGETESITDSVREVHVENGRTYHTFHAGSYAYPNDEREIERLKFQHKIITKACGNRYFFAPLPKGDHPLIVLDIATGTGDWVVEVADKHQTWIIRGTDITPIQPEIVPPNIEFVIETAVEPWDPTVFYDYVHTRMTLGCWDDFSSQICGQAYRQLKPGGWFESTELDTTCRCDDGTMPENWVVKALFDELSRISDDISRAHRFAPHLRRIYEEQGFEDVQERILRLPMTDWGRQGNLSALERCIGGMWEKNMLEGVSAFSMALFSRYRHLTQEQVEVDLVPVKRELSNSRVHAYMNLHCVWGRKPGGVGSSTTEGSSSRHSRRRSRTSSPDSSADGEGRWRIISDCMKGKSLHPPGLNRKRHKT